MALRVGNDFVFFYNTGSYALPNWVSVCIIGDLTVNLSCGEAPVDLRCSNWILNLPAKLRGGFEFLLANDIGGADFNLLRAAFFNRTVMEFASSNGPLGFGSGSHFFRSYGFFREFPWQQNTEEMSSHQAAISLSLYYDANNNIIQPSWNIA